MINDAQIPAATLSDRAGGHHHSQKDACAAQQLLTPEQEQILVDWAKQRGEMGKPFLCEDLCTEATAISGKMIGQKWPYRFIMHHQEVQSVKPSKMDPKHTKNFNKTIINDYFDKLKALHTWYDGIPPEHIWNMDEKGIQMGGSRKGSNKKFYYLRDQKQKCCMWSDNLELVTVLECVSMAGDIVPPSFCLKNGSKPDLCTLDDNLWGRWVYHMSISSTF